jgi:hypothetical protein
VSEGSKQLIYSPEARRNSDMTLDAPGSRVSMIIRLAGLLLLALGVVLTYFTYTAATAADIVPQIVPVFYLGAGLLMLVGIVAVIAKYK